jgi:hypothetical protein
MRRNTNPFEITTISGNQFPDLQSAQRAALPFVADNLQVVIEDLIQRGALVVTNGKLIPNSKG